MPTELRNVVLEVLTSAVSPYLAQDPIESALAELARYFGRVDGIVASRVGWPEHPQSLDLGPGPVVTVTFADEQRVACAPAPTGDAPVLWRTGDLTISAQLDVWAAYRAQRVEAARVLEEALHNELPHRQGLRLASRGYHQRTLSVEASVGRNTDEPDTAIVGEWRRTWMLTIRTDLVGTPNVPTQQRITLRPTADGVADPDLEIT